jgi:hypothetical protein
MIMKCPCEECLKMAICRLNSYGTLIKRCPDLRAYLLIGRNMGYMHLERACIFEKALKPSGWEFDKRNPSRNGYGIRYKV